MRKITIIAALCALWAIGGTTSQAATITVFHGTETETFDTDMSPAGGVHMARPASTPAATPSPVAANRATRPPVATATFVAGDTLWFRSARTGRLAACAFGSSGKVGKYVIRCTGPDSFGR